MDSYLATGHDPVGNSQEGQADGDTQHRPAFHPDGLLSQSGEVLVPDSEKLLLTVWMGNKLAREGDKPSDEWKTKA